VGKLTLKLKLKLTQELERSLELPLRALAQPLKLGMEERMLEQP
jgi:hypothetical protein